MHAARCQYVICIARRTAEQCPDRIRYRAAMPSQHVLLTSAWGHMTAPAVLIIPSCRNFRQEDL